MAGTTQPFELAVCAGEFQLPDPAAIAVLRHALDQASRCLVFLTWAHAAPSPAHPFAWEERAACLRAALPQQDRARIEFLPLRQHYDAARTSRAMEQAVRRAAPAGAARMLWLLPHELLGARDDRPAGWTVDEYEADDALATRRLHRLYEADDPARELAALQADLEPATVDALRAWLVQPVFERVREDHRRNASEQRAWSVAPYPVVLVTVDAVVRAGGHVLLVQRGRPPGRGLWALPGGFLDPSETVLQGAVRELAEETGLPLTTAQMARALRGVKVFDDPRRSQRGRIVTHAHFFDLGDAVPPPVRGADDAAAARWVPVDALCGLESQLHDDHFHVLDQFLGLTGGG
jgi:bifunctional NMN adenylyltransferase/nudix hydrolase